MSGVAPRRGTRANPGPWIEIHGYLHGTAPRCGRDSRSSFFQPSVETLGYFLSPSRAGVGATGWGMRPLLTELGILGGLVAERRNEGSRGFQPTDQTAPTQFASRSDA